MAFSDEVKEEMRKDGGDMAGAALKEAVNETPKTFAPKPQVKCIAVPDPIFEKMVAILSELSYKTVGTLMEDIKKEALGVNLTKQ